MELGSTREVSSVESRCQNGRNWDRGGGSYRHAGHYDTGETLNHQYEVENPVTLVCLVRNACSNSSDGRQMLLGGSLGGVREMTWVGKVPEATTDHWVLGLSSLNSRPTTKMAKCGAGRLEPLGAAI